MKKLFFVFLFFNFFSFGLEKRYEVFDLGEKSHKVNLQIGEELLYDVNYGFIKIGEIKLKVIGEIYKNGKMLYVTKAFINSNNLLPFVNVHYVFYSEIDVDGFAHFFSGIDTKNPKEHHYQDYVFNYSKNEILIDRGNRTKNYSYFKGKDVAFEKQQDGLSLFYFARINLFTKEKNHLPTYINETKGSVYIDFLGNKKNVKISAVNHQIETVELNGNIKIKGIFGLSGPYVGWFSNDNAAIPIKAKLKVLIGNVDIELKSWQRKNWSPPIGK